MKVFVTGATGLVGSELCRALAGRGDEVVALSRSDPQSPAGASGIRWVVGDPNEAGAWVRELAGCDAVVHLAGEPIAAGRWTSARKRRLVDSRVGSTETLVEAIRSCEPRPASLLCGSASGVYGARGEELLDEASPPGEDFLARLCVDWEAAARGAETLGLRVVSLRLGVVLSTEGGALKQMLPPFRLGLGGPLGPAKRWFPWIHHKDVTGLLQFALDGTLSGPLNLVSPEPVRMGDFARELGGALGRPAWLPLPAPLLKLALGEMGEALVPGQRIAPQAALAAGYPFRFGGLAEALADTLVGAGYDPR